MRLIHSLLSTLYLSAIASGAILLPREPKGASGGGGGHGGSGGGRSSGSSSSSGRGGASTGRGGSGDTGHAAISYGGINTGSRNANYFSGGGGHSFALSESSVFHGRQMGGGLRADVPGTRAYGSGYPYSVGGIRTTGVSGQSFPFGFWPIYWGGRGHSGEYGENSTVASQRPGGSQVIVQLAPNPTISTWNTTTIGGINETYWMIGDKDSVATLLSILIDPHTSFPNGCGVQNATVHSFNSSELLDPLRFESVIQWYRSSSFALAYEGYNNSYAQAPLNETASLGWNDSTPLPALLQYSPFLQCINATISAALPILDQEAPPFTPGEIAGIVLGCFAAALFLCCCVGPCICAVRRDMRDSRERKAKIIPTTIKSKPALVVTSPPSDNFYSSKSSPSPWASFPSSNLEKLQSIHSHRSSLASTAFPDPVFINTGRESFNSSRTLIADTNNSHRHKIEPIYYQ